MVSGQMSRVVAVARQTRPGRRSEQNRPGFTAAEVAGQQKRGAAAPDDPFGVAAFDRDGGAAVVEVKILDIELEHRDGAAGGFVEHSPEQFFAE